MAQDLRLQVTGFQYAYGDLARQHIEIGFKTDAEATLTLVVPRGVVSPMLAAIQTQLVEIATVHPGEMMVAQPLKLRDAIPFQLSDGRKGLNFRIESFELPVLLSETQISALQSRLSEVEALKIDTDSRLN